MVYRMTQTQYIWNRHFFLCLFIIEIEMWKKYLVFILDELLNDCVIPAAGNICVVLDLLHVFCFFTLLFSLLNCKCHLVSLCLQWKQKQFMCQIVLQEQRHSWVATARASSSSAISYPKHHLLPFCMNTVKTLRVKFLSSYTQAELSFMLW